MELRKFIATTIREYLNEQQNTKNDINDNFMKWFRNSEMVKHDGTPIVFYHGTNKEFDKFDKSMINTSTDEDNERLAELNDIETSKKFTNDLILQGYDGVYYNGNLRGETVVFEPNQIWEIDIDTINENININNNMKTKEIIELLNSKGIKVSKKENFYNGSNYGEKYTHNVR